MDYVSVLKPNLTTNVDAIKKELVSHEHSALYRREGGELRRSGATDSDTVANNQRVKSRPHVLFFQRSRLWQEAKW